MLRSTHAASVASFSLLGSSFMGNRRIMFDTPSEDNPAGGSGGAATKTESLSDEMTRLQNEAQELFTKAKTDKRDLTDDEQKANELRFTRLKSIKTLNDQELKFAKVAFDAASLAVQNDEPGPGKVRLPTDPPGKDTFGGKKIDKEKFSKSLLGWSQTGVMAAEFATITTATSTGLLLPKSVAPPITPSSTNAFRDAYDIYGLKPLETDNTAELVFPIIDANAGGKVDEAANADGENTPALSGIDLKVSTYGSGAVWFSNQQLLANDFDLLGSVVPELIYGKELGLESDIVTTLIADSTITNVTLTDSLTAVSYNNLVDLNNSLPKRYDKQKVIVLAQTAFNAARKLVGSDGHPVLVPDPQNGDLFRFNGTPVLRSDYFASTGVANHIIGAVYSLLGFKLRDVTEQTLTRYINDRVKRNQTGLELFSYHAYGWSPLAVGKLKCPAS